MDRRKSKMQTQTNAAEIVKIEEIINKHNNRKIQTALRREIDSKKHEEHLAHDHNFAKFH